jgi:hypothetical protein
VKIRELESIYKCGRISIYIITGDSEYLQQLRESNVIDGVILKPIIKKELVTIVQDCLKV